MRKIEKLQTPYFLIHKKEIDKLVDEMFNSLSKYWRKFIVGYSFKTNNLPWVITYMKSKGMYAEVVSSDEFNLALELGFQYKNIIFNGPVKGEKEFKRALEEEGIINLDSKRELRWIAESRNIRARIGLRVNFDIESLCPGESQCGLEDGRFGFSYETGEFEKALNELKNLGINISGIHLHCSSKTRSKEIYKAISEMAVKIVREYKLKLSFIDIGGGFFGGVVGKPTFDEYFSIVNNIFSKEKELKDIELIVEPGMSVVGATMDYVTSVVDEKKTLNNRFILLDGSRIHIDPLMKKTTYNYVIEDDGKNRDIIEEKQTLSGFTCMENDRFLTLKNEFLLKENDKVIFKKVGAYTIGLSPLFIQFYPDIYVQFEDKIELVQKRWSEKEFLKNKKEGNK